MKQFILSCLLILVAGFLLGQGKASITDSYNAETARNYTRALQIMEDLNTSDPNDEFYILRIAWLQYLLGRYNDSLKNYQKSNNIFPSLDAQTGILNCQLALGLWNDAHNQAEQILKKFSQNIVVLSKAAYATYMLQNYRATADYYQRIINISPWDMEARGYLVNNLYLAKDIENARKHYQILIKYAPDSAMAKEYSNIFK
ncbi:MAG TPA: tetratricopeptide repeat protein [Candidatus Cloacimonas sp.]|nr:tetratricopeptide repeat protein [Candidatus Cloacimonas sp.]HPN26959.1 tetratricopeptide repeat protein [Candidatus Cloacimonas sp.]HPZ02366.1 tetratricopeptide repeat protein [Candidatus Cloacimonas sp.]HQB50243.1 tetratricopeptide repeat protein [Candidatus Cloacimonas sp.]HQM17263.1 tetratricopeptide repeat protein [Candidatus Cloacimonas sp.]